MNTLPYITRRLFVGAAFALVGVSPGAHAQSNTIHACVNNNNGSLSLVAAGTVCKKGSTLVSWNIVGPTGATGATGAQGSQGADGIKGLVLLKFQSTVSAAFGGLPAGIAVNDTVAFSLGIPTTNAEPFTPAPWQLDCRPDAVGCQDAGWSFTAVPYRLTYSSGYTQVGTIDQVVITDGGSQAGPHPDTISFYSGGNDIWKVEDPHGTAFAGPISTDLFAATKDIDRPALFDLTFYMGSWGNWGTYHYDYLKPQDTTIVTRMP